MEHNNEQQEKKAPTFLYAGGTGAFTLIWMLMVAAFIFWIVRFG